MSKIRSSRTPFASPEIRSIGSRVGSQPGQPRALGAERETQRLAGRYRLNFIAPMLRGVQKDDTAKFERLKLMGVKSREGAARLPALMAQIGKQP
jgi:hypothetical protein